MILANKHILKHFTDINKLSAYRVLAYVQHKYNNDLHRSNFPEMKAELQITSQSLYKALRDLRDMGIVTKVSNTYYHFKSWKKWLPAKRNRCVIIFIRDLRSLKRLRSLRYMIDICSSIRLAKRNVKEIEKDTDRRSDLHKSRKVRDHHYQCSLSFIKAVTNVKVSQQTLSRHIKKLEKMKMLSVKRHFKTLFHSPNVGEVKHFVANTDPSKNRIMFNKSKNLYSAFTYSPNRIRLNW